MSWLKSKTPIYQRKNDPRLGNQLSNYKEASHILCGYPDDEGVGHNGGRLGAKEGPEGIRSVLYKATIPDDSPTKVHDIGNLDCAQFSDIDSRHQWAIGELTKLYQENKKVISLGGGHDYGYPDSYAFYQAFHENEEELCIINFDAHLDVRPIDKKISSGTPFYRLLENTKNIHFIEIGLLELCNSTKHIQWLKEKGGKALFYDSFAYENKSLLQKFNEDYGSLLMKKRKAFISIDIDCFSSAYAPGCSQSWPFAMSPQDFFPLFQLILARWDVKGIGLYEVAPPLDENLKTQRLSAQIIHKFLYS